MFIVRDYAQKIRIRCKTRDDVLMSLVTFGGFFKSRSTDIKIEDCKTGKEMSYAEFITK